MTNTLKTILLSLLISVLILGNILLFYKKSAVENQLGQARILTARIQAETETLTKEKDRIAGEKERLQADITSYLAGSEKLQNEKEMLRAGLEKAQKELDTREADLARLKDNLERMEKKTAAERAGKESDAVKEARGLKKKIYLMDKKVKRDQALLHYNMGVAFTQARRYDEAISEYNKSLYIDPANADAHYNLGIIYDNVMDDGAKAVYHYRTYLMLKPKAADRDDIEQAISNLKS